jgi:predicted transcriptional regulator
MKRVEAWPEEAQAALAEIALEMDEALQGGLYHPSDEELAGIDRGLADAGAGHVGPPDAVATLLAKHRPA